MRICLVAHGFPPYERSGVENYTAALARALARAGHRVNVFAPRSVPDLPDLSLRREERDGYQVTWLNSRRPPRDPAEALDPPQLAERFGAWLDLERPEVVHLQHVLKLGLGFIERAAERGLAVVYTAHDYYPICHRFTLLRPDLTRCSTLGDADACTRCDLALGRLNTVAALGDYHLGAFPESLPAPVRASLGAVLEGDVPGSGLAPEEWASARARRLSLDRRRAQVFRQVDLVLAPTRFLADQLIAGGLPKSRIEVLPYGIDTAELATAVRRKAPHKPLRFGYVGSLTKHKGVHVLLDAFEALGSRAELHVHGDSTDKVYVGQMRDRAKRLGAHWHGAFEARDLPRVLAGIDVLVAPSIWVENQPLAIREAFAAGLPVVTSDLGALPESVRDGVDGLLVPPGDPRALAAALARLVDEAGLFEKLRRNVPKVKDVDVQVAELATLYEKARALAKRRLRAPPAPLPHLADVAARHGELDALPFDDLFARVVRGLERLGPVLGAPEISGAERTLRAFAGPSATRETLADMRTERTWLQTQAAGFTEALGASQRELRWREERVAELEREIAWWKERSKGSETGLAARAQELSWREAELAALRGERDSLAAELKTLAEEKLRERKWLEDRIAASAKENEWLRGERDAALAKQAWLEESRAEVEQRAAWLEGIRREQGKKLLWLEGLKAELDGKVVWLESLRSEREPKVEWLEGIKDELERKVAWLEGVQAELEPKIAWLEGAKAELEPKVVWLEGVKAELEPKVAWLEESLAGLGKERDWLAQSVAEVTAERDGLRDEQRASEAHLQTLRDQLAARTAELEAEREQRRAQSEEARARERELETARRELEEEFRAAEERSVRLQQRLSRETERAEGLQQAARAWLQRLEQGTGGNTSPGGGVAAADAETEQRAAAQLLERFLEELRWRRGEMRAAAADMDAARSRWVLARTHLGRRAVRWGAAPPKGDDGRAAEAEGGGG